MEVLNLANPEGPGIKFKISRFPDGQQSVSLIDYLPSYVPGAITEIKSRLNDFKDLELIICANQALKEAVANTIRLYCPYFIGARSDRKFSEGTSNYLKTVISPIINSQNFDRVTIMDPHSDVLEACINKFYKLDNTLVVKHALSKIYPETIPGNSGNFYDKKEFIEKAVFVSPDAGALKKIYHVAAETGFDGEVLVCSKYRDIHGVLSKTHVPVRIDHYGKDIIIIDDICDGGRTFINIADEFKRIQPERTGKIYLIITHGIFSAGLDELAKSFDGIFCTNSVKDIKDSENYKAPDFTNNFVRQLNIFD